MVKGKTISLLIAIILVIVVGSVAAYIVLFASQPQKPSEKASYKVGLMFPFTGPFGDVAKTQYDGALLAIEQINAKGIKLPDGRILQIEYFVRDDELKAEVAVTRFYELRDQYGIQALVGTLALWVHTAINVEVSKTKTLYFTAAALPVSQMKAGTRSKYAFGQMSYTYTIGYISAKFAVEKLGARKVYYLGRPDPWGWEIRDGIKAYLSSVGLDLYGYDEAAVDVTDYSPFILKIQAAKPDVVIFSQFGAGQAMFLKQAYMMNLQSYAKMFCCWITNAAAAAVPADALADVYALHFYYWGAAKSEKIDSNTRVLMEEFNKAFLERFGYPPDSYAVAAYLGTLQLARGIELAGSTDPDAIVNALENSPKFVTFKGNAYWRKSHDLVYDYAMFVVKGKKPEERKERWDLFHIIDVYGGEEVMPPLSFLGYS